MPNILGIIPARYASQRFPGKPLADIHGKPMIQHVYEQATRASALNKVVIATDDERIYKRCIDFGAEVVLTGEQPSGTDRCKEAYFRLGQDFDFIINIQGDEPFINPSQIDLLASSLHEGTEIATLIKKIDKKEDITNANVVKAVVDQNGKALYFSRCPIPYQRNRTENDLNTINNYFKHLGIYAYRQDILRKITELPQSKLELSEALEQLRWLENGYSIQTTVTTFESRGIDTPEDLEKINLSS